MITKNKSERNIYYFLFLAAYFLLLIYLANKMYIWEDESYSLHTSSHSLSEVIKLSNNFEGQPPFYFALLAIWRLVDSSIFFARLLSVIFIFIAAYFFKLLTKFVVPKAETRWLVVLFLLNPFVVWAALEIRLYALVILLSTISIYYFLRYYLENKNKYLYILLIISLIGLYTQYFVAFLITSFALSILMFKGRKEFFKFCLYFIPVVLLFLPNLLFFSSQLSMAENHVSSFSAWNGISRIIKTPQDFILGLNTVPVNRAIRWVIKVIFLIIFLISFSKYFKENRNNLTKRILYSTLFSIAIIFILFFIAVPSFSLIYQDKYLIIVLPLLLFLFFIFNWLPGKNIFFIILSLYYIFLIVVTYRYPMKSYDFKKVSSYLKSIETKKEPILFYGKTILPPFEYYYTGQNKLYGLPAISYDKDYYEERITDTTQLINSIDSIFSPTNSYILITGSIVGFKYDSAMSKETIQKSLRNHFNISLDSSFQSLNSDNTLRVQKLEKK